MSASITFRRIVMLWAIIATFAVLISSAQMAHLGVRGRAWWLVPLTFVAWLAWAPLTPPIVALARRYPIRPARARLAVGIHLAAALVSSALIGLLWDGLSGLMTMITVAALPAGNSLPGYGPWRMLLNPAGHAMIGFITYACIVVVVGAVDATVRSQQSALAAARLERDVAVAREQAIKMQVHPHFLFNTLHAISMLTVHDPSTARAMITDLGEFLRATLARVDRAEVTVREELDLLDHYFAIEQRRFGDRLSVSIGMEDGTEDALVPDLILQPIAENAIKHGVSSREGQCRVSVRVTRSDGELVLTVEDDGAGSQQSPRVEGVGLRATRERLLHLYGGASRLSLAQRSNGGMRATIGVPYHVQPLAEGIHLASRG